MQSIRSTACGGGTFGERESRDEGLAIAFHYHSNAK